jgi:hypothetical protein
MTSQTLLALAALVLTAGTLAATLWLFLQLKMEIARLTLSLRPERRETEQRLDLVNARLDEFAASIEKRNQAAPIDVAAPPQPGLNIGKRIHVLRLSRRGDAPQHIAATLHLPRREVELLLKVHELSLKTVAANAQAAR